MLCLVLSSMGWLWDPVAEGLPRVNFGLEDVLCNSLKKGRGKKKLKGEESV